jgi:hypothetical protein
MTLFQGLSSLFNKLFYLSNERDREWDEDTNNIIKTITNTYDRDCLKLLVKYSNFNVLENF